jgi:hypothetical protein
VAPRRAAGRRSPRLLAAALVATIALLGGSASPASAHFDPKHAYGWAHGGCPSTGGGQFYAPYGQVKMVEWGKSNVQQFQVTFKLYAASTVGFNLPKLQAGYYSGKLANTAANNYTWLPNGSWHRWTDVFATNEYTLTAHLVWYRGWFRRNYSADLQIAYCQG